MRKRCNNIIGKSYKYFNSAVLIPLVKMKGETQLLFEQRSAEIIQGNEICFPGGAFDTQVDSCPKDTAIRESCEELGIARNKIRVLAPLGTLITPLGVALEAYVGKLRIRELEELNINKAEVERVFTLPLSWFRNNPPKEYHLLIEVHPFRYNSNNEKEHLFPVKDYALPQRYEKPWKGQKYPVFVYDTPHGVIWGITAELIREFLSRDLSRSFS